MPWEILTLLSQQLPANLLIQNNHKIHKQNQHQQKSIAENGQNIPTNS